MGNYHPLSMLCYAIGYKIGGFNPWPYQTINLLLHISNTFLVFILTKKIDLIYAKLIPFITTLLFGIHTIHVESVAWISENKNVLYTFFFLLSLIQYINYTKSNKRKHYIFAFLFFIFSLLSKAIAVSLSLTLLILDYLFERKIFTKRVFIEKVPFFLLPILFGIIALYAQKSASAIYFINEKGALNLLAKISVAGFGLVNYLLKLILPINFTAKYEYLSSTHYNLPGFFHIYPVLVVILIISFYKQINKLPIINFGIFFFLVNIFFVLQLFPVGDAMMAER